MNLSSLLKFGYRGALLLLVLWYLVGSFVYVGSCNLIGQYVVFSSFPRLNVEDSRSKKRLGKNPTLFHLLFFKWYCCGFVYNFRFQYIPGCCHQLCLANWILDSWTFLCGPRQNQMNCTGLLLQRTSRFSCILAIPSSYSRGLVEMTVCFVTSRILIYLFPLHELW